MGGMGPAATVDFLRRVVELTPAEDGDRDHLHMLIDNDPSVPDRTKGQQGTGPDPSAQLAEMARGLEAAGADALVMVCNSAYLFADAVTSAVQIPLIDWPDVVARHAISRDMSVVGVLATTGTVQGGLYRKAFAVNGGTVIIPGEADQGKVMSIIEGIKKGECREGSTAAAIRQVGATLVERGAQALLLACTELSLLAARQAQPLAGETPVLDASEIVARHIVNISRP